MNYRVSIILPVYNVSAYIMQCLQSIHNQTLTNVEVIFVDDKGTDDSISIIQEFINNNNLSKDWYIISLPTNQGPAAARNIGINAAKGEYISFIDADDWIEPKMMEELYHMAILHNADISSSAAILDYANDKHTIMANPSVGSGIITEHMRRYLLRRYVSNFTTMLFKREWIQNFQLRFPNAKSGEDSSFMGQCYLVANRIAQSNTPNYHYVIHSNSISHRKNIFRGCDKHKAFSQLFHFARANKLLPKYRFTLYWIYIKKVIMSSIIDYIKSYI